MKKHLQAALPDGLILLLLLLVPLLFFWPQAVGGKTLLPVDNLFSFQPYAALADEYGIGTPHNGLLSDLLLENYVWKQFIRESVAARELPLWQPYILAGTPFLAAGQSSALYPFSALFYIMPLAKAYGWFTASQLWLAGACMYLLVRVLGIKRYGALIGALTYQLSGFMLVSVVFPMILAVAAWLPFQLTMVELIIRQGKGLGGRPATMPWVALGAVGLGMAALAGHVEALYFTLLVMGFYALWRLLASTWARRREPDVWRRLVQRSAWLLAMVALGLALGAVQIVPAYELASRSFREGAASLAQVRGWAYPARRVIAFLMPNFFGSPAHHTYFDLFQWHTIPVTVNASGQSITSTDWGIKNYVEGGAYLGLLPMALALIALIHWIAGRMGRRYQDAADKASVRYVGTEIVGRPCRVLFAVLAVLSVSFVFGTPTYALLYYGLPFINQSHSPFRWVWPLVLSIAVLAGFGADILQRMWRPASAGDLENKPPETLAHRLTFYLGWGAIWSGAALLVALVLSRTFYGAIGDHVQRIFEGLARAPEAFPDGHAFYSYEARNILLLAVMLIGTGITLRVSRCGIYLPGGLTRSTDERRPVWEVLAVVVLTLDMGAAIFGFFPAADPALLDVTPPVVKFLRQDGSLWRFISYEEPGADTMNSNVGWMYGLQDASGYDSLIPGQYAHYMGCIAPQDDLQYNRIAPIYTTSPEALNSPLLDLLGVKYVVSEVEIDSPKYTPVYSDEAVRVYENQGMMPRAFTLPLSSTIFYREGRTQRYMPLAEFCGEANRSDVRQFVLATLYVSDDGKRVRIEGPLEGRRQIMATPSVYTPATITAYTPNEIWVDVAVNEESWLVIGDSYFPGWRAWVRPIGTEDKAETEVDVWQVDGNFRGVILEPGTWTVRMKYSPDSIKLGAFTSFISGMVLVFVIGVWVWRYAYRESAQDSAVRRVAKNSFAPIILNLFNRGIQFAFAFISLRILGPQGAGNYSYAVVIWGWFEIFSNFGLNTLLTREVARNPDDANRHLANTSLLRLALALLGIPLLYGFIALRQRMFAPPLTPETVWTLALLYAGLFFSTQSTGLTALFYAYEKAEYPAAIQTVSTILMALLGVLALLSGLGIVGLAGVSIITNGVTLIILYVLTRRLIFRPVVIFDWSIQRMAVGESFPLMINHLLATLFFKIDIVLMEMLGGNMGSTVVGWYSTAYKWVDALNIIPAFFTQAIFPVISRQATEDRPALLRSYILAIKLLVIIALPVAVITTLLAYFLIGLLGGAEFLPHGAIALQLMIWSIPIGWINSITNYVLIALNRQHVLTWTFVLGVLFNVGANLYFLPRYSYPAAAVITIASELVLLTAFYVVLAHTLRGDIPDGQRSVVPWFGALWRPVMATALMAIFTWLLARISTLLALVGGIFVYGVILLALRPLSTEERALIVPLLPECLRRFAAPQDSTSPNAI